MIPVNAQPQSGPPGWTTPPSISGTATVGQVLTGNIGALFGHLPTLTTQQWLRSGVPIGGATALTYTVVAADSTHSLTFQVTASSGHATAQTQSAPLAIP
jgi:hypothetical protein